MTTRIIALTAMALLLSLTGCSEKKQDAAAKPASAADATKSAALPDSSGSPTGSSDPEGYPVPSTWPAAGKRQAARAARSFQMLKQRHVPVLDGPLFVDDDEKVTLQTAADVARRTLVLWAVELRAEGIPRDEAHGLIDTLDLWDSVSPKERAFLEQDEPDEAEAQALVWRLESIWVLLWALGEVDELNWPESMCDVPKLVEIMKPLENNPDFIANAKLRDKAEILDAQDLTMRIHWAIRDAHLNSRGVPATLDWSAGGDEVPVDQCAAVGVVEQRHYVLNWLVKFLDPQGWDDVDTPT